MQGRVPATIDSELETVAKRIIATEVNYPDDLLKETAEEICYNLYDYAKNPHTFRLYSSDPRKNRCKDSDQLPILPHACQDKQAYMSITEFVRSSIADMLEIEDSATLENQLPSILKKLSHYQCPKVQPNSSNKYYKSMRSFPKLVLFFEQNAPEFYERLAFPEGKENIAIDINAVDCVMENGKLIPETLLDYTTKASNPNHPSLYKDAPYIRSVRQRLEDFGAKKGQELNHKCIN